MRHAVRLFAGLAFLAFAAPAFAGPPYTIWDSTLVSSGAVATSGVRDLSRVTELQVFVDNTSGGGFRDLTMTSFAPDGVTTLDAVLLRRVAWGSAPTGSSYAPGRVRGYVGPNPPGGTTGVHTIYDGTGSTAATVDTDRLFLEDADQVFVRVYNSGSSASGLAALYETDDAGATGTAVASVANVGAGAEGRFAWGPGTAGLNGVAAMGPTRSGRVIVTGASNAVVRVRVVTRGRTPGSFAHQMALPPKAKFSVSAANGTARFWVVGR